MRNSSTKICSKRSRHTEDHATILTIVSITTVSSHGPRNTRQKHTHTQHQGLLEEGVIPTMRDAKVRLLEPDFVCVPSSAEVWVQCYESKELHSMSHLVEDNKSFRVPTSASWVQCPGAAAPASLQVRPPRWGGVGYKPVSLPVKIFEFDFANLPEPSHSERRHEVSLSASSSGTVHALVCWWRCFMVTGHTVVLSTAPPEAPRVPSRDHWRQSVYILPSPVDVETRDVLTTIACHDDFMVWFDGGVSCKPEGSRTPVMPHAGYPQPRVERNGGGFGGGDDGGKEGTAGSTGCLEATAAGLSRVGRMFTAEGAQGMNSSSSTGPPVCLCGLHRAYPPNRIWMLNSGERTRAFRRTIRRILGVNEHDDDDEDGQEMTVGNEKTEEDRSETRRGRNHDNNAQVPLVVGVISDGFLLPLISAKAGASDVITIQPSSTTAGAVCRDVYMANGIDDSDGRKTIRNFPGNVQSVYDLLADAPGSSRPLAESVGKLDALVGEPYFDDMAHSWPMEDLLLFWCVRTALEARGLFSPRTRVLPARARLLACPIGCDMLFRTRRRVGLVEGVDMSAVNEVLGCRHQGGGAGVVQTGGPAGRRTNGEDEREQSRGVKRRLRPDGDEEGDGGNSVGGGDGGYDSSGFGEDIVSVRLSEYPHSLFAMPVVVLDMDLTEALHDLRGGRKEIHCNCRRDEARSEGFEVGSELGGAGLACHGVALWLELWLDEEGEERLSTGPEVGFWEQGLVLFEEEWAVPRASGRSFHFEAVLEDGALRVELS